MIPTVLISVGCWTKLVVEGARRMLVAALEAEVACYIDRHLGLVGRVGYLVVVRNGKAEEQTLVTGAGGLKIRAPRVDDRREGHRFASSILPRYAPRSPKVADVLPVLYLRGLPKGDFAPALEEFCGTDAGLSALTITRLVETWSDEYRGFEQRDLKSASTHRRVEVLVNNSGIAGPSGMLWELEPAVGGDHGGQCHRRVPL